MKTVLCQLCKVLFWFVVSSLLWFHENNIKYSIAIAFLSSIIFVVFVSLFDCVSFFGFWGVPFISLFFFIESFYFPSKGHVCVCVCFQCLALFLLSPPPFYLPHFFTVSCSDSFLCFSLLLVFIFYFGSWFLSLLFFLSCLLLFHEKQQQQNIQLDCFSSFLSFLGVSCLFFVFKPLFLIIVFLQLTFRFSIFSASMFFFQKNAAYKNSNFWSRGGLQHKVLLLPTWEHKIIRKQFFCATAVSAIGKLIPGNYCVQLAFTETTLWSAQITQIIPVRKPCATDVLCDWEINSKW